MISKVYSCALAGLEGELVEVEVDLSPGFPCFTIVGLPDPAINEAKERIKSALKNADVPFPYNKRLIINLAPADLRKIGPAYDLPMAAGILLALLETSFPVQETLFVGELALDGSLRRVNGMVSIARFAARKGFRNIFFPAANLAEAELIAGLMLYPLCTIGQLIAHMTGSTPMAAHVSSGLQPDSLPGSAEFDMGHVRGQEQAKRALEIAAAGGHNVLLTGPPGTGKTMLARSLPSILPDMSYEEMLEVTQIYSIAGLLSAEGAFVRTRPFRAPHHSASGTALVGGGKIPKPGEITMAHRGVLFLDEFPEFSRKILENLRQPLEQGTICVVRASGSVTFPARFILVASQNPCPCGYASDPDRECTCTVVQINNYQKRISGPILDRIDMHIEVPRLPFLELSSGEAGESSATIRARVEQAREVQTRRFTGSDVEAGRTHTTCNGEMTSREIREFCVLDSASTALLQKAVEKFHLSARVYFRIIKLARTIADLAHSDDITSDHIAEALQYRMKEGAG